MRVLIADDDPVARRLLEATLRRWGWDVLSAGGGEEAAALAEEHRPEVVITDILMPDVNGYELCRRIKATPGLKDVPVILLTALSDPSDVIEALQCGADGFITKPYDEDFLAGRIENLMARGSRPETKRPDGKIEMRFADRTYVLKPDVKQTTNLLLSTYDNALQKNLELKRANDAVLKARDELKALNASLEEKVKERTFELDYSRQDIIWRLAKAAECRDRETGSHVTRVACYSQVLAQGLGMPADFVSTLFLTSPLHDIGKIGVPDRILGKRGKLTPEERKIMESHCRSGAAILEYRSRGTQPFLLWRAMKSPSPHAAPRNPILKMAAAIALTHHERWDGTGYPGGLKGEAIRIEGRIVAVADAYDALSTSRPYKPPYDDEKTLSIMKEGAGRQFDPVLSSVFERLTEKFRAIRTIFADETDLEMLWEKHNA